MTMLSQFSLNNGYEVVTKIFSGGEVQVTLKPMSNAKSKGSNVICLLAYLKCANGIIALAQIKQILNRDADFIYVAKFFPKIHIQLNHVKFIARTIKYAKQYFSAHDVVTHTGLSDKNLGLYIKATMDKFPDKFDWAVYCLASPHSEILELMDKNYKEVTK